MDPVTGPCGTGPHPPSNRPSPFGPDTETSASERGEDTGERWIFRRGHSDGDVLTRGMGPYRRMSTEGARENEETWMDFMRQVPDDEEGRSERARLAIRRAAMVAADRKRHIQETREDYSRRRSASTISLGQSTRDRMRQQFLAANVSGGLSPSFQQPNHPNNLIDINRPLPQIPSVTGPPTRPTGDIILPRWQPDAEVSHCPICSRAFAFWYRKHHCRKCGRVVCANCSPHRITIPRQFIVHPPEDIASGMAGIGCSNIDVVDLTGDDDSNAVSAIPTSPVERSCSLEHRLDPALGGGQEVRLCNPCVPDPNPLPPPTYPSSNPHILASFPRPEYIPSLSQRPPLPTSSNSASSQTVTLNNQPAPAHIFSRPHSAQFVPQRQGSYRRQSIQSHPEPTTRDELEQASARRAAMLAVGNLFPLFDRFTTNLPPQPRPTALTGFDGSQSGTLPGRRHTQQSSPYPPQFASNYGSVPGTSSRHALPNPFPGYLRYRSHASTTTVPTHPRYRSMLDISTPLPPIPLPPPPPLKEEDECPICHSALPPKGPDGSETVREAHVAACIETHFSSSGPRAAHPPPETAIAAAVAASSATPAPATGASSVATDPDARTGPTPAAVATAGVIPRRRVAGMVVYHASEKDCIGEDGEGAQECVICFEEFAVGEEMGRLECLCKFHKVCAFFLPCPFSWCARACEMGREMADFLVRVDLYTAVVGYERRGGLSGASGWSLAWIQIYRGYATLGFWR